LDYKPKNSIIILIPPSEVQKTSLQSTVSQPGLISMEMCESLAANNQTRTTHKKYKKLIKLTEILGQVSLSQNAIVYVNASHLPWSGQGL
jgi:hypothetical protein